VFISFIQNEKLKSHMDLSNGKTVAEMVTDDIRFAHIFKKYGIDFCCGGGKTIHQACIDKGVSEEQLLEDLQQLSQNQGYGRPLKYKDWNLPFLIDFIENVHHSYIQEKIPILVEYVTKVAKVHGMASPELNQVRDRVLVLKEDLLSHLIKEEQILFPFARKLSHAKEEGAGASDACFQSASSPIGVMEHEHDSAGDIMKEIRRLTGDYSPPAHACNTFRALYALLEDFEADLHQHVHLENNILFPKILKTEEDLRRTI
jgi:regulator of cell morphogenesis and NO signaling